MLQHIRVVQSLGLLEDEAPTQLTHCRKPKRKGKLITLGNENWYMVQHLMLGIRQGVGEATHSLEKELKTKDFEEQVDFRLTKYAKTKLQWIILTCI